ncbi:MAG: TlyA family RNA methyltransferase [Bacillota bacterium]|nr:TlyA family RNA methyltransferase [Bacillota bacterium]
MDKIRADVLLTQKGLTESREKARIAIQNGLATADGKLILKPSETILETAFLELSAPPLQYVGRGGYKLEKALREFKIDVTDYICMDIGASTGGFTDCLLQNGAKRVYAIDVGINQLSQHLAADARVVSFEKTNIRQFEREKIDDVINFITVDVSFISLSQVFPKIYEFLKPRGEAVCLIKPQFEAGRFAATKTGVVKDKNTHIKVITSVLNAAKLNSFTALNLDYSPIKGGNGNIEYLLHMVKDEVNTDFLDITKIVTGAFENL